MKLRSPAVLSAAFAAVVIPSVVLAEFVPRVCPLNARWEPDSKAPLCYTFVDFSSYFEVEEAATAKSSSAPPIDPGRIAAQDEAARHQDWWHSNAVCETLGGELAVLDTPERQATVINVVLLERLAQYQRSRTDLARLFDLVQRERHARISEFDAVLKKLFASMDGLNNAAEDKPGGASQHLFEGSGGLASTVGLSTEGYHLAESILQQHAFPVTEPRDPSSLVCWTGLQRAAFGVNEKQQPTLDGMWRNRLGEVVELSQSAVGGGGAFSFGGAPAETSVPPHLHCLARSEKGWHTVPCETKLPCAFCQRTMLTVEQSHDWSYYIASLFERHLRSSLLESEVSAENIIASMQSGLAAYNARSAKANNRSAALLHVLGDLVRFDSWVLLQNPVDPKVTAATAQLAQLGLDLPLAIHSYLKSRRLVADDTEESSGEEDNVVSSAMDIVLAESGVAFAPSHLTEVAQLIRFLHALSPMVPESTLSTMLLIDEYWRAKSAGVPRVPDFRRRYTEAALDDNGSWLPLKDHLMLQGRQLPGAAAVGDDSSTSNQTSSVAATNVVGGRIWSSGLQNASLRRFIEKFARRTSLFADGLLNHSSRLALPSDSLCYWVPRNEWTQYLCGQPQLQQEQFQGSTNHSPLLLQTATTDAERWAVMLLGGLRYINAVDFVLADVEQKLDLTKKRPPPPVPVQSPALNNPPLPPTTAPSLTKSTLSKPSLKSASDQSTPRSPPQSNAHTRVVEVVSPLLPAERVTSMAYRIFLFGAAGLSAGILSSAIIVVLFKPCFAEKLRWFALRKQLRAEAAAVSCAKKCANGEVVKIAAIADQGAPWPTNFDLKLNLKKLNLMEATAASLGTPSVADDITINHNGRHPNNISSLCDRLNNDYRPDGEDDDFLPRSQSLVVTPVGPATVGGSSTMGGFFTARDITRSVLPL